jgi:cytidine deaminase
MAEKARRGSDGAAMMIFRQGRQTDKDIHRWLTALRKNAYAPESGYIATAVVRSGDFYFAGVNVEIEDHRLATHAEEGALAALAAGLGPEAAIDEVWVMGAPRKPSPVYKNSISTCCGKCRQQISAFAAKSVKVHSFSMNGKKATTTVGAFLPDTFILIKKKSRAPKKRADKDIESRLVRKKRLSEKEIFKWLAGLPSVSSISKTTQSIALKLDNGAFVAGTKIEDAAFLDISAAQSAVAIAVSEFGPRRIEGVWVHAQGRRTAGGRLTLSSLQTLLRHAGDKDIPVFFQP